MKKQDMINELMEGTNFAYPQMIRKKLNRKTTSVIEFYFNIEYRSQGMNKESVIKNIIYIG